MDSAAHTKTVVGLDSTSARDIAVVGGKGANLGHLSQAGYHVPPAFVVTTHAYEMAVRDNLRENQIRGLLAAIDYEDIADLDARTAEIRELVGGALMPPSVATTIAEAYGRLGPNAYVAVRSSGTAEDLEGTSFAGLHDTYLDVIGEEAVIDAVKRCWASLWSARAVQYRQHNGFDHLAVGLAVVVQQMVESETSGVMFTANPRTSATDETVINASWGLGEAVVQGIITPDEFTVKAGPLRIDDVEVMGSRHVLERSLGSKQQQFIRNPETGQGTVVEDVRADKRGQFCLTDDQVIELAALGARVTRHYGGWPQDLEWAFAGGELFLLQSRPITGVEFSWDADVNAWQPVPDDPFGIRSRGWADEAWTGAITPLMFSWRGHTWNLFFWDGADHIGRSDLRKHPIVRYHKGTVYLDCLFERHFYCDEALPSTRQWGLDKLPEAWHEDIMKTRFGVLDFVKQYVGMYLRDPGKFGTGNLKLLKQHLDGKTVRGLPAHGLPDAEIRTFTDAELEAYVERVIAYDQDFCVDLSFPGFMYILRDAMAGLSAIIEHWYDGDNPAAFTQLVTGTATLTASLQENVELAEIAEEIRNSPDLTRAFEDGVAFFDTLEDGSAVKTLVDAFLAKSGHRGHADRDIYFPRYADDPRVLHRALAAHLISVDTTEEMHARNTAARDAAYADVVENLRRKPLGTLRAEAFKYLHDFVMQYLEARDNERHHIDKNTYTNRRAFLEVGRRLLERGQITELRDVFFLTQYEVFDLLLLRTPTPQLSAWKIEGRKRNFDRFNLKEVTLPKFLQREHGHVEVPEATRDEDGNVVLRGIPTSGGEVTATARVVKSLDQIGTAKKGEILVANSTDPGWTPVFAVLSGVIVETGGLLSHSGCLAREYGFPAAQVENAIQLIPDGATVRLDGNTGTVYVIDVPEPTLEALEATSVPA
jgi:rifampicin phosphotransferase